MICEVSIKNQQAVSIKETACFIIYYIYSLLKFTEMKKEKLSTNIPTNPILEFEKELKLQSMSKDELEKWEKIKKEKGEKLSVKYIFSLIRDKF